MFYHEKMRDFTQLPSWTSLDPGSDHRASLGKIGDLLEIPRDEELLKHVKHCDTDKVLYII